MPLVGFLDFETTGGKVEDDRIIETALLACDLDTGDERLRYVCRSNPQKHIAAGASRVHGIMDADVMNEPLFVTQAPELVRILAELDLIVWHNGDSFDGPLLAYELMRVGVQLGEFPPTFDTMLHARWATADGKIPTLGEMCWSLDVDYDPTKAHEALYDILVMRDAFFSGLRAGAFELPALKH